jgi:dihydroorotate dehydrogenase
MSSPCIRWPGCRARRWNGPIATAWWRTRSNWPGLKFPNRVGLAAGLDKNARCIDGLGAMGFGFVEVGTVTPKAQPGNPKPRMFRLPQGQGADQPAGLQQRRAGRLCGQCAARKLPQKGRILGLNIGKNAATPIENATATT